MNRVVGKGSIASRFARFNGSPEYFIFAGSVHDSSISNIEEIQKEEQEVKTALALLDVHTIFIYFSSCSIGESFNDVSVYTQHKKRMEAFIRSKASQYLIFRLPQVIGLYSYEAGIVNYLMANVTAGKKINVWENAGRNLIDLDDVYAIVCEILNQKKYSNCTINVASPVTTSVTQMVSVVEHFLNKTADVELIKKGESNHINIAEIKEIIDTLEIDFGHNYFINALAKYYLFIKKPAPLLSLIVPTYNQESGIDEFYRRAKQVLQSLEPRINHEFIFVNDCSADNTFCRLKSLAKIDSTVKVVNFSRNFGNQIAITAGVKYCNGDLAVIIDDDLQDPPEIILDFIARWYSGYKVVYGVRPKRSGINPFFKMAAKIYYRILSALSDTKIPNDTGDFRLIDKVVIDQLREMKEENRYYRGMVAWLGFSQIGHVYERDARYAGVSNFSLKKYINFALNGLTSFTDKPLYFSSMVGFLITAFSFVVASYLVINKILNPQISIQGWTSIITIVMFFGGVQLFSIGILGVYISKIYREVKGRPLFIVQDLINID